MASSSSYSSSDTAILIDFSFSIVFVFEHYKDTTNIRTMQGIGLFFVEEGMKKAPRLGRGAVKNKR